MNNSDIEFTQRKITKSYRSTTGHFPSIKNNKSIGFESDLESKFFLTLEFDNDVATYLEQPQIEITVDGKLKTYSVDCLITRPKNSPNKNTIVEVKYTSELEKRKEYFDKKFKAAQKACDQLDFNFVVFTEQTYNNTYIANLDFLYRYKTQKRETKYDTIIKKTLHNKKMSALDLANLISNSPSEYMVIANAIWGLVADKILSSDLYTSLIDMNSIVELRHGHR